jgi:AAA domain-containing protein/DnaB helicase-like protein
VSSNRPGYREKFEVRKPAIGRTPVVLAPASARELRPRLPAHAMLEGHEQVLLSALMNGHFDLAVTEQDFGSPPNRSIFIAIKALGQNRSWLAVKDELQRRRRLKQVGGEVRLIEISNLPHDPGNVEYALGEVMEASRQRRAMEIGTNLSQGALAPEEAVAQLSTLRDDGTMSIRSPESILALPFDELACMLGNWLLAKGQSLVIAGVGAVGKTRLLLQLLVALILGRPWCGIETHARARSCLLLQTENGNGRLQRDLAALKKWAGKHWTIVEEKLRIHTIESDTDSLRYVSDPENRRRVETVIRKLNPDILALDPLRDFGFGDLNTDADMAATLREVGHVTRADNPDRALILVHHAITGRAGVARAFGLERTGFARNSKVLHTWARGMINVVPAKEDSNDILILTCGKNSNGPEFPPIAVKLNPDMIYDVADGFNIDTWREHVINTKTKATHKFDVGMLYEVEFEGQLAPKPLVTLICEKIGCGRSRAYELLREGAKAKILRFDKLLQTYVKA